MGKVLQPYWASPSLSSISFIASLTREITNAKPPNKNASRKYFKVISLLLLKASLNGTFAKNKIRTVHAANKEMTILPMRSLRLSEVEYNHNNTTQNILAAIKYHLAKPTAIAVAAMPNRLSTKCHTIAHRRLMIVFKTFLSGLFILSILDRNNR